MNDLWNWSPGIAIGPFHFGAVAAPVIQDYCLQQLPPDCSIADWETFELPGFESRIVVEKGKIVSVHCEDMIQYKDCNLIGLLVADARELLGLEDECESNVGLGYALYYNTLGLTLFVVNDIVDAAACGPIFGNDNSPIS